MCTVLAEADEAQVDRARPRLARVAVHFAVESRASPATYGKSRRDFFGQVRAQPAREAGRMMVSMPTYSSMWKTSTAFQSICGCWVSQWIKRSCELPVPTMMRRGRAGDRVG
jgi:hypothetical protein